VVVPFIVGSINVKDLCGIETISKKVPPLLSWKHEGEARELVVSPTTTDFRTLYVYPSPLYPHSSDIVTYLLLKHCPSH